MKIEDLIETLRSLSDHERVDIEAEFQKIRRLYEYYTEEWKEYERVVCLANLETRGMPRIFRLGLTARERERAYEVVSEYAREMETFFEKLGMLK